MHAIPADIIDFLRRHHVVSLTTQSPENTLWSACCFYAFDEAKACLVVFTAASTRHGRNMLLRPHISGTVAGQPQSIREIEGIQFQASAKLLDTPERERAAALFTAAHPAARSMESDVWALSLEYLKLTDNRKSFAHKTHWQRSSPS